MYGLVLSGVAMQMVGFSRPASGSEHHISHFIEMNVLNKENSALCDGCSGAGRICCNYVVCAQQRHKERIKVIIVGEKLGY